VKNANYVVYVSQFFLQSRYPTKGLQRSISNVIIENTALEEIQNKIERYRSISKSDKIILSTLAAIDVPYKGHKYVLKAIAILKNEGFKIEYRVAGIGNKEYLEKYALKYGVQDNLFFEGLIERNNLFNFLDKVDIYVQPSKTEGLPRAMIEAMSRACVCIGSNVGGIPELVSSEFLFEKANAKELSNMIKKIILSGKMNDLAQSNFEKSKLYTKEVLEKRRTQFYDIFLNEI
jgi:glycosyltransferase involved in cell wall biosynthesis